MFTWQAAIDKACKLKNDHQACDCSIKRARAILTGSVKFSRVASCWQCHLLQYECFTSLNEMNSQQHGMTNKDRNLNRFRSDLQSKEEIVCEKVNMSANSMMYNLIVGGEKNSCTIRNWILLQKQLLVSDKKCQWTKKVIEFNWNESVRASQFGWIIEQSQITDEKKACTCSLINYSKTSWNFFFCVFHFHYFSCWMRSSTTEIHYSLSELLKWKNES